MTFLDSMRKFGASCPWWLRALGRGYLSFGLVMSHLVMFVLLSLIYWGMIPFFSFLRIGDPLRLDVDRTCESFWEKPQKTEQTVTRHSRLF